MSEFIIQYSRQAFCFECYKAERPKPHNSCFIAILEEENFCVKRKISSIQDNFKPIAFGFTPHIYFLKGLNNSKHESKVVYTTACGICGVNYKKLSKHVFDCSPIDNILEETTILHWNRMVEEAFVFNSK